MKKLILLSILGLSASVVYAQQTGQGTSEQTLSKNGQPILPEAGSYGLGFDAVPFLEYFGNIFNGTANNSVGASFPGGSQQFFGKYFLARDFVVRVRGRIDKDVVTNGNRVVLDDQANPDPEVQVTDNWTDYNTFIRLGGGVEYRRGSGRVNGIFGGEASLLYGNTSSEYNYGNPITEGNPSPTTTPGLGGFNGGRFERIVENKNSQQFGLGLNAFAGIEYFVAPKIALGAEFAFGFDFIKNYNEKDTFEFWDADTNSLQTRTAVAEGGSRFSLYTGNYGGSINLLFYF